MNSTIKNYIPEPHGGNLIQLPVLDKKQAERMKSEGKTIVIELTQRDYSNLYCISQGIFSPLKTFMGSRDYYTVIEEMKLSSGDIWPIPIVLSVNSDLQISPKNKVIGILQYENQEVALINIMESFIPDKKKEAEKVFGTTSHDHPGVQQLYASGDVYISGELFAVENSVKINKYSYNLTPKETRELFVEKGWRTIVGFMTRNPLHRAHEYLHKSVLTYIDGVFINPLINSSGKKEISADVKIETYEKIIDLYYPKDRTLLNIYPAPMNYAGPKEAILHAIARKNFGCTHFIVGRDHAGVGDYYQSDEAVRLVSQYSTDELGIKIIPFDKAFYCFRCTSINTSRTCPHEEYDIYSISGSKIRDKLERGIMPFDFEMRPEIAYTILDKMKRRYRNNKTFCLWFTGLSGAGKSTIAQKLKTQLYDEYKIRTQIIDGDIIRSTLSKDLGFSPEDRFENIRRIGILSKFLVENGVSVISATISPYKKMREMNRDLIPNFIEVYINTPLDVCESRDVKGLYKLVRTGEISNFTGIDAPYEIPTSPDIEIDADTQSVESSVQMIIDYLKSHSYIV